MNNLTIEPRKKVKPFLRTKRRSQARSAAQTEKFAKTLGIPFAANDEQAARILDRWKNVIRYPDGTIIRDAKRRPQFFGQRNPRANLRAA